MAADTTKLLTPFLFFPSKTALSLSSVVVVVVVVVVIVVVVVVVSAGVTATGGGFGTSGRTVVSNFWQRATSTPFNSRAW